MAAGGALGIAAPLTGALLCITAAGVGAVWLQHAGWPDPGWAWWLPRLTAAAVIVAAGVIWSWLLHTRAPAAGPLPSSLEVRRGAGRVAWVLAYLYAVAWGAGLFARQDAYWANVAAQAAGGPTGAAVLSWLFLPLYALLGVGGVLYALTRPMAVPPPRWPVRIVYVLVPMLLYPDLGARAWYHTSAMTWELFRAGYWLLALAWVAVGVGGMAVPALARLRELMVRRHLA